MIRRTSRPGDLPGVPGRGPLGVVEVRRHGDHGLGHALAEVAPGVVGELAQDQRRDLLRRVQLVADLDPRVAVLVRHHVVGDLLGLLLDLLEPAADEALDRVDRSLGVEDRLPAGQLAHQPLTVLGERHHRRRRARALGVGDDVGLAPLPGRDHRVGRSEVDTSSAGHIRPPSQAVGRFVGHVVVDDHLEALRAHHRHRGEVAAAALQGIDDDADDRADDGADDQAVHGEQQARDQRVDPAEDPEDPADQCAGDSAAQRAAPRGPRVVHLAGDLLDGLQVLTDDRHPIDREPQIGETVDGPFGVLVPGERSDRPPGPPLRVGRALGGPCAAGYLTLRSGCLLSGVSRLLDHDNLPIRRWSGRPPKRSPTR